MVAASPLAELLVMHGTGQLPHEELGHRDALASIDIDVLDGLH